MCTSLALQVRPLSNGKQATLYPCSMYHTGSHCQAAVAMWDPDVLASDHLSELQLVRRNAAAEHLHAEGTAASINMQLERGLVQGASRPWELHIRVFFSRLCSLASMPLGHANCSVAAGLHAAARRPTAATAPSLQLTASAGSSSLVTHIWRGCLDVQSCPLDACDRAGDTLDNNLLFITSSGDVGKVVMQCRF